MMEFPGVHCLGKQFCLGGYRVVTVIDAAGDMALIAEDGKWYLWRDLSPLTTDQSYASLINSLHGAVKGKTIASVKPQGAELVFLFSDNSRLHMDQTLKFYVVDPEGQRVF